MPATEMASMAALAKAEAGGAAKKGFKMSYKL